MQNAGRSTDHEPPQPKDYRAVADRNTQRLRRPGSTSRDGGGTPSPFAPTDAEKAGRQRCEPINRKHSSTRFSANLPAFTSIILMRNHAKYEFPINTSDAKELRLRLQWSKYGKLQSTENVDQYGFLSASDIRLFLQLGLRIRNNDVLLDLLLADIPAVTQNDLASAKKRMNYPIETTRDLINRLVEKRPGLRNLLIAMRKICR
jgi:hypothetical protein